MAWGNFTDQKGGGERRKFVTEGNIDVMMIPTEKSRVKVLTTEYDFENHSAEEIMAAAENDWIMPKSIWMHAVPSIPNVRFFSQIQCGGRTNCRLCMENDDATERAGGALENKNKPYPVRKRYALPVWSYDLEKVLYLLQNEQYMSDIQAILEQFGTNTDLLVWKEGTGMRTNYKIMYAGPAQMEVTPAPELTPAQVDLYPDAQELARRLGTQTNGQAAGAQGGGFPSASATSGSQSAAPAAEAKEAPPVDSGDAASFVIPFGKHKGQTLEALAEAGEMEYLQFLRGSAGGLLKQKVNEFLASLGQ